MMNILQFFGSLFLIVGSFFIFVGSLGVLRMPDVFNKLQAGTKATTLGFLSLSFGLLCLQPSWALKIIIVAAFIVVTNPIGSHALARAANNTGAPLIEGRWSRGEAE